jgi:DNA-binding TFAR19-related protein (PDSD5 family)
MSMWNIIDLFNKIDRLKIEDEELIKLLNELKKEIKAHISIEWK